MTAVRHLEVVIPARDEQGHIGDCLDSVRRAVERLRVARPGIGCGITVVLDSCSDRTGDIVRRLGAHALACSAGCVGAARALGVDDAMDRTGVDPDALWIACTDADSAVPEHWLEKQVRLADSGIDAVIGTVTPTGFSAQTYQRWLHHYDPSEGHDHVHGANLGFRAGSYARAGGFPALDSGEDVELVARLRAVTTRWVATHETSVLTSGRTESRVDGGFATFVAGLGVEAT